MKRTSGGAEKEASTKSISIAPLELLEKLLLSKKTSKIPFYSKRRYSSSFIAQYLVETPFNLPKSKQDRENVVMVCVQHILETTASMFQYFIELGIKPENIYLLGKNYSTCDSTKEKLKMLGINVLDNYKQSELGMFAHYFEKNISQLYDQVINDITQGKEVSKLILLDDGGRLIKNIPRNLFELLVDYRYQQELATLGKRASELDDEQLYLFVAQLVIAIEQTTAGYRDLSSKQPPFYWLSVASSELKKSCESFFIAKVIVDKITAILKNKKQPVKCGIIGLGSIGRALANELQLNEYTVEYFDANPDVSYEAITKCSSVTELVRSCDFIMGCTGYDVMTDFSDKQLENMINGNKIFISCSSEDKEFNRWLKYIKQRIAPESIASTLDDIHYNAADYQLEFVRGGFPINFDGSEHSVPADNIAITRALILTSIIVALYWDNSYESELLPIRREPPEEVEQLILELWSELNPDMAKELADSTTDWVADILTKAQFSRFNFQS